MISDININVKVNVGTTPELTGILRGFLGKATAPALPDQVAEKPQTHSEKETAMVVAQEAEAEKSKAVEVAEEAKPQEAPAEALMPTEREVRAAMEETRKRLFGSDYKTNPTTKDSANFKKYWQPLKDEFIRVASHLGSDRPSQLAPDKRQQFINACITIGIKADGTVGTDAPF